MELFAKGSIDTLKELGLFRESKGLEIRSKQRAVKNKHKVHVSSVSRILKNILYTGYIEVDTKTYDKKTGKLLYERNIPLKKGKHEGIISLDTHYKIKARFENKHQPTLNGVVKVHPDFPLRGFLHCAVSDRPLT